MAPGVSVCALDAHVAAISCGRKVDSNVPHSFPQSSGGEGGAKGGVNDELSIGMPVVLVVRLIIPYQSIAFSFVAALYS